MALFASARERRLWLWTLAVPLDILFNLLAGAMAVGASVALAWARRWTRSRRARRHVGPSR